MSVGRSTDSPFPLQRPWKQLPNRRRAPRVHADHLNTPRRLTDASQAVKWQWPYSGFGEINPQSTPAAGQAPLNYSLRYPG